MNFSYEIIRLWERSVEDLLAANLGVAMLGHLPESVSLEEGLAAVAQRVVDRVIRKAPPERVTKKLLTDAYLLTGLRVRRDVAARIFRGVRAMHESDTYLAILDEGQEKATREDILVVGEEQIHCARRCANSASECRGRGGETKRMLRRAVKAANWQEILETP